MITVKNNQESNGKSLVILVVFKFMALRPYKYTLQKFGLADQPHGNKLTCSE